MSFVHRSWTKIAQDALSRRLILQYPTLQRLQRLLQRPLTFAIRELMCELDFRNDGKKERERRLFMRLINHLPNLRFLSVTNSTDTDSSFYSQLSQSFTSSVQGLWLYHDSPDHCIDSIMYGKRCQTPITLDRLSISTHGRELSFTSVVLCFEEHSDLNLHGDMRNPSSENDYRPGHYEITFDFGTIFDPEGHTSDMFNIYMLMQVFNQTK